jgi:hypothetical protein
MIKLLPLALAPVFQLQADPLEEAKRLVGKEMECAWVEKVAILATEKDDATAGEFRQSFGAMMGAITGRAFTPALDKPLLVCRVSAERYLALSARLLGQPARPPAAMDPVQHRVILLAGDGDPYVEALIPGFLLAKHLGTSKYPPYLMTGVTLLVEKRIGEEDVFFDSRAAMLKNPLLQGRRPPLKNFLVLGLAEFNDARKMPIHAALAHGWFGFLESRKALKPFIESYRKTMKRDTAGIAAAEAALGKPWAETEKEFQAYVRELPWIDRKRFEETGKKILGDGMRVRIDDEWALALSGVATEEHLEDCVRRAKALAPALVQTFDMTPSGLPILARLFGSNAAFEAYAKTAANKEWVAGFYMQQGRMVVADLSGGGTNVFIHELCHCLFIDDFHDLSPTWLGEGLAGLFEQFTVEGGTARGVHGTTLGNVRKAWEAGKAPHLKELIQFRGVEFHDRLRGRENVDREKRHLHYQLARAIVLFLQDRGALVRFYTNLRKTRIATARQDPFCLKALEKELGLDIEDIEKEFVIWLKAKSR